MGGKSSKASKASKASKSTKSSKSSNISPSLFTVLDEGEDLASWTSVVFGTPPSHGDASLEEFSPVDSSEAFEMLSSVDELQSMFDRRGEVLVQVYMLSTLETGLPLFHDRVEMNESVVRMAQYVFHRMRSMAEVERKRVILELARGYQSCQTVQYQILTRVYATLANVERTFEEQTFTLLGEYKKRLLDELVILFNPNASEMPDDNPHLQAAHIRSAYLLAMDGAGVHIEGKQAAASDRNAPSISSSDKAKVEAAYRSRFRVDHFVCDFIADINLQHSGSYSRCIDRDKFYRWVQQLDDDEFEKHSIFYMDDHPEWYESPQSEEDRDFVPFLCPRVALKVLEILGMIEDVKGKEGDCEEEEEKEEELSKVVEEEEELSMVVEEEEDSSEAEEEHDSKEEESHEGEEGLK